ncbi:ABC transporter permease [Thiocystis violascens]|uniref:ABC-type polysaccharide/polyol phosphate export systems, permease component n=1 Tax=Thiocystis violascens (strain ATCC 17096 / DSM 198 / 6111) TaxID=765911 RepID=I3Y5D0_THIV6|nr:ABC transporter permease [Thiocystis violascens]AFL72198.1 ABC-type polysaccharide/polyol phosphate export systems, permease component [Thiocystis violascens DSM 198]
MPLQMTADHDPSPLPVTLYTPDSRLQHPGRLLREMFRDLAAGRELAWRLAVRDISAQYRQAVFGLLWAFILPLANTLTWIFLSASGVVAVGDTALPYPVYVFTGAMLWAIFMDALNAPLQQTAAAKSMLAKLNFPREALIVSGIYQTLFNAGIKIALLLPALLWLGVYPDWSLLLFPLGVLSLILVGTAVGLLLTPVGILYSDIGRGLPLVMQFLMYITPVVFPMPKEGLAATLFNLNPLTPLIVTARDWLTGLPPELLGAFVTVNLLALVLLLMVWVVYRLAMPILIERMSA